MTIIGIKKLNLEPAEQDRLHAEVAAGNAWFVIRRRPNITPLDRKRCRRYILASGDALDRVARIWRGWSGATLINIDHRGRVVWIEPSSGYIRHSN
jgi:hypothetical protein